MLQSTHLQCCRRGAWCGGVARATRQCLGIGMGACIGVDSVRPGGTTAPQCRSVLRYGICRMRLVLALAAVSLMSLSWLAAIERRLLTHRTLARS
jgi:hypothetical protein